MAFSQVQCLDDSHVNWRSSESKPEFFYSEEQRLALEALVAKGPDAFYEVLKKESIRDFLSELEVKKVLETLETYDPGADYPLKERSGCVDSGSQTDDQGPGPSLEYWPERSDRSIPQLDLGWPEAIAYRGVTRAAVYMQPPIDCQPHIKEVVRKMIFQAQKVVAVVMDMFTDVDIFKDLLDVGFKRKVAVYIIIDESNLKYFLQMCDPQLNPPVFPSSFTWSAARTDRNVISVLSGQVVEAFDKQFQELYLMSRSISLKSIPMGEEPEPEPVILPSVISLTPSNSMVKKLVNPKYALVKAKSSENLPPTLGHQPHRKGSQAPGQRGDNRHSGQQQALEANAGPPSRRRKRCCPSAQTKEGPREGPHPQEDGTRRGEDGDSRRPHCAPAREQRRKPIPHRRDPAGCQRREPSQGEHGKSWD
uniref:Family with sequence similarity 83 member G n=1 Tax=Naja naja TaxID=35670 RepID=A0A8C7E527_NAJNA